MKTRKLAAWAVLALAAAAHAEDQECAAARKNTVSQALAVVDEIESHIEAVPPDEASYLETEWIASVHVDNQVRLSLLHGRPFFPAWALHGSLHRLRNDLSRMREPNERFQVKSAATVLVRLSIVDDDFDKYIEADNKRKPSVMNRELRGRYNRQLGNLPGILLTYIDCTVDAIK